MNRCPICGQPLTTDYYGEPECLSGHSGARLLGTWSPPVPETHPPTETATARASRSARNTISGRIGARERQPEVSRRAWEL